MHTHSAECEGLPTLLQKNCFIQAILTKTPPTLNICADVPNMQWLWYNRRTCSIKKAQRQLDLTGDNTPIHHHGLGDSTSLHRDSSQRSAHTHACSCVTKNTRAKHTATHVSITTSRMGLFVWCTCVCARPPAFIHIYYSSACEHMKVSLVAEIRSFFISDVRWTCAWVCSSNHLLNGPFVESQQWKERYRGRKWRVCRTSNGNERGCEAQMWRKKERSRKLVAAIISFYEMSHIER